MTYKNVSYSKASFQADIKRKQALFNRFKRRYHATNNTTERKFLKNEATRVVNELRQWCKRWQNWGFGGWGWITKNYTVTDFTCYTKPTCQTTNYKSPTTRTYGRSTTRNYNYGNRTGSRRTSNRRSYSTRSSAARRTYSAW